MNRVVQVGFAESADQLHLNAMVTALTRRFGRGSRCVAQRVSKLQSIDRTCQCCCDGGASRRFEYLSAGFLRQNFHRIAATDSWKPGHGKTRYAGAAEQTAIPGTHFDTVHDRFRFKSK